MTDRNKVILWNIPIIGLIYFIFCLYNTKWWFENYIMWAFIGTGIQCITLTIGAALLKNI